MDGNTSRPSLADTPQGRKIDTQRRSAAGRVRKCTKKIGGVGGDHFTIGCPPEWRALASTVLSRRQDEESAECMCARGSRITGASNMGDWFCRGSFSALFSKRDKRPEARREIKKLTLQSCRLPHTYTRDSISAFKELDRFYFMIPKDIWLAK